jgi:hypothetical protein
MVRCQLSGREVHQRQDGCSVRETAAKSPTIVMVDQTDRSKSMKITCRGTRDFKGAHTDAGERKWQGRCYCDGAHTEPTLQAHRSIPETDNISITPIDTAYKSHDELRLSSAICIRCFLCSSQQPRSHDGQFAYSSQGKSQ